MLMMTLARARRPQLGRAGVALPVALIALVAISLLVTAALVTSSTEAAVAGAHRGAVASLYGTNDALTKQAGELLSSGAVGGAGTGFQDGYSAKRASRDGGAYTVRVARLFQGPVLSDASGKLFQDETFSLVSSPSRRADLTEGRGRMVGALIDVRKQGINPNLNIAAGVSLTADVVTINGSIVLSGKQDDKLCNTGADVNAVDLASGVVATIAEKNVEGGNSQVETSTMSKTEFATHLLGGNKPLALMNIANIKYGHGGYSAFPSGAVPNSDTYSRTDPDVNKSRLNWGCPYQIMTAPQKPCALDGDQNYFPVIAIKVPEGTSEINPGGAHGQGILIVDGNLHLNSNFRFNGIVVVLGNLIVNGNAEIQGALLALGDNLSVTPDGTTSSAGMNGNALVRYNSCNVEKAKAALAAAGIANAPQVARSNLYNWFEVVR